MDRDESLLLTGLWRQRRLEPGNFVAGGVAARDKILELGDDLAQGFTLALAAAFYSGEFRGAGGYQAFGIARGYDDDAVEDGNIGIGH